MLILDIVGGNISVKRVFLIKQLERKDSEIRKKHPSCYPLEWLEHSSTLIVGGELDSNLKNLRVKLGGRVNIHLNSKIKKKK